MPSIIHITNQLCHSFPSSSHYSLGISIDICWRRKEWSQSKRWTLFATSILRLNHDNPFWIADKLSYRDSINSVPGRVHNCRNGMGFTWVGLTKNPRLIKVIIYRTETQTLPLWTSQICHGILWTHTSVKVQSYLLLHCKSMNVYIPS